MGFAGTWPISSWRILSARMEGAFLARLFHGTTKEYLMTNS